MTIQTKNPQHQQYLKVFDTELTADAPVGIGCTRHGSYIVQLLPPELCAKCNGHNGFAEFCPVCRDDCECE